MTTSPTILVTGIILATAMSAAAANPADTSSALTTTNLTAVVTLILALSVASERLVEIIKGWIPSLDKENIDPAKEGRRRSILQVLAVASGMATALLARAYIPTEIAQPGNTWSFIGLGLLASGGSGFWNSILTYVTKLKDIKKLETEEKKQGVGTFQGYRDLSLGEEQVTSNECYDVEEN